MDQICLNLQKLLSCLAILTSTIFRAPLINLPCQSNAFFILIAVCRIRISRQISYIKPYHFCYSSFLKTCKAVANRPLKQLVIANDNGFSVWICGAITPSRKNLYKFIARAGVTPTLLCFLLAPGSLRSRRALP